MYQRYPLCEETDTELQELLIADDTSSMHLRKVSIVAGTDREIACDVSHDSTLPFVPCDYRRTFFDFIHGMNHPCVRSTQKAITTRFV